MSFDYYTDRVTGTLYRVSADEDVEEFVGGAWVTADPADAVGIYTGDYQSLSAESAARVKQQVRRVA